jgi:hypothetical protein
MDSHYSFVSLYFAWAELGRDSFTRMRTAEFFASL